MDNKELVQYRAQLFRDAVNLKQPDRIPNVSHVVHWRILEQGYTLKEALTNWDLMEQIMYRFQEKYPFDGYLCYGNRNNYETSTYFPGAGYVITDDTVNYRDFAFCDNTEELIEYAKDPDKFMWEKGIPKKYHFWNDGMELDTLNKAFKANQAYIDYSVMISAAMKDKYGVPLPSSPTAGNAGPVIGTIRSSLLGIRNLSIALRRNQDQLDEAIAILNERNFYPAIEKMKTMPAGTNLDAMFDTGTIILDTVILNHKQMAKYVWPYMMEGINILKEKGWCERFFTQASSKYMWDMFEEIPSGVVAYHMEKDDLFEAKKALPHLCVMGGITTELLNYGTKQQVLDTTKRLIDELGSTGLVLCQDKMLTYRNDGNPENVKAYCDFVQEYRPSSN